MWLCISNICIINPFPRSAFVANHTIPKYGYTTVFFGTESGRY
jgi:hypothetical protein